MGRHQDRKLRTIAESVVGRHCSERELLEIGRTGDLVMCSAGETFHSESDANRWAYLLLDGDVAMAQNGDPLAVATTGAWFPLRPGERGGVRTSLTALSDSQLLVFRWSDLGGALELPALVPG